ncbi:hypothetical protein KUCAC02_031699, partial [Chaenocephalus aceratus]
TLSIHIPFTVSVIRSTPTVGNARSDVQVNTCTPGHVKLRSWDLVNTRTRAPRVPAAASSPDLHNKSSRGPFGNNT